VPTRREAVAVVIENLEQDQPGRSRQLVTDLSRMLI